MAEEVIVYGNPYGAIRTYLMAKTGADAFVANLPPDRPSRFIVIDPAGGDELSVTHAQRLVMVDTWGATVAEAQRLAELTRAHLKALRNKRVNGVLIYSAAPSGGLVWMPDPDAQVPRFRQNFILTIRGEAQ